MKHSYRLILLMVAGLLAACGQTASAPSHPAPATVKRLGETNLNEVTLTEEAARRLAIQTALVREEQVARKRMVGGEVLAVPEASTTVTASSAGTISGPAAGIPIIGTSLTSGQTVLRLTPSGANKQPIDLKSPRAAVLIRLLVAPGALVEVGQALFEVADISTVLVRAPVYVGELDKLDRGQLARILPLARDEQAGGVMGSMVDIPSVGDSQTSTAAVYYLVDSANHGLVPGQRVRVEFSLANSGTQQKIVPYASVIYDLHGDTWAYTNPAPFTFVRQRISVDYIDGDLAVLSQGPDVGVSVVTVGAAELFGTEFGIGK